MKNDLKILLIIVLAALIFIPFVKVEARTVGIPETVATLKSQDESGYQYEVGIDFNTWFIPSPEEGEIPYALIDGWELYEKVDGQYTLLYHVDESNGEIDVDQPYPIEVNVGNVRTFVTRNFVYDENLEATYSSYSEEVVLDHRVPTTIMMRVHHGKGCYSISGEGLEDYVCGERDYDEVDSEKVGRKTFTVPSGTEVTVKAIPEDGFSLDGWYGFDPAGGKFSTSVILISDDVEYTFTAERLVEGDYYTVGPAFMRVSYEVIEGADQTYIIDNNTEAKFRINADYSLFENDGKVYIDDELVDSSNYTSASGSTIITLKKGYVDTLFEGEHTLKVVFNDGISAITSFVVTKTSNDEISTEVNTDTNIQAKNSEIEITPPLTGIETSATGDSVILYIFVLLLSIIGFDTTFFLIRRMN